MRWRWNKTFKGGTHLTPGSQNWLTRDASKEKMIEALTFLINGRVGSNICIVCIPPNPRWDAECNMLLLQLLFKKKNIFSLNMGIGEVGKRNSNVVDDFIQLLLKPYNTTTSTLNINMTSLAIGWFGSLTQLSTNIDSSSGISSSKIYDKMKE